MVPFDLAEVGRVNLSKNARLKPRRFKSALMEQVLRFMEHLGIYETLLILGSEPELS